MWAVAEMRMRTGYVAAVRTLYMVRFMAQHIGQAQGRSPENRTEGVTLTNLALTLNQIKHLSQRTVRNVVPRVPALLYPD